MATLSSCLTNRTALYLSQVIAATMYQWPGVHLDPPTCRCYKARIIWYPGSDIATSYTYSGYRCVIWCRKGPQEYRHHHHFDRRNTLIHTHSPHLCHEPRLANCSYAWSRRLCGITGTIQVSVTLLVGKYFRCCLFRKCVREISRHQLSCKKMVHWHLALSPAENSILIVSGHWFWRGCDVMWCGVLKVQP
jgi:hypothetical protein